MKKRLFIILLVLVVSGCASVEIVRTDIPVSGDSVCVKVLDSKDESVGRILADAITMELRDNGYGVTSEEEADIIITGVAWLKTASGYALLGSTSAYSGRGSLYGGGSTTAYINTVSVRAKNANGKLLAIASYSSDREQWTRNQPPTAIGKKLGRELAKKLKE